MEQIEKGSSNRPVDETKNNTKRDLFASINKPPPTQTTAASPTPTQSKKPPKNDPRNIAVKQFFRSLLTGTQKGPNAPDPRAKDKNRAKAQKILAGAKLEGEAGEGDEAQSSTGGGEGSTTN